MRGALDSQHQKSRSQGQNPFTLHWTVDANPMNKMKQSESTGIWSTFPDDSIGLRKI